MNVWERSLTERRGCEANRSPVTARYDHLRVGTDTLDLRMPEGCELAVDNQNSTRVCALDAHGRVLTGVCANSEEVAVAAACLALDEAVADGHLKYEPVPYTRAHAHTHACCVSAATMHT
jgi:hypothetical protein